MTHDILLRFVKSVNANEKTSYLCNHQTHSMARSLYRTNWRKASSHSVA